MSTQHYPNDWFAPAPVHAALDLPVLPPESYWQGVWRRLKANRRAFGAAVFLIFVLLFTVFGSVLWPVDPAKQDPGVLSRSFVAARSLPVAMPDHWQAPRLDWAANVPVSGLAAPANLHAVSATSDAVRLVWQPVAGAQHYRIYRREGGGAGRGIPLAVIPASYLGYEDRLDVHAQDYHYTVIADDGLDEAREGAHLMVRPIAVISLLDAQLQGLVPLHVPADIDTLHVDLPMHPLGTDHLGRDMLARLIAGGQTSFFIGFGAPLLYIFIGCLYGAFSSYVGGRVDESMMRFADFVIALPFLLFMILLRVAFGIGAGESGVMALIVAMVLLGWPMSARLVRGQVLQLREQPFVAAARLMGAPSYYLVWRHMIPNVMGVVIVSLTFAIPGAIFTEAFLSFIGMGVVPPIPSWGSLCNDGIQSMLTHPHELLYPAALISMTVLAFNVLGDGLRDALDVNLDVRS
ncbi:MAG TPA: ABC transporter permease [Pseudomonadales bacterium]